MLNTINERKMKKSSWKTKKIKFEGSRIYYSAQAERKIFFLLTLLMLSAGIMFKLGLF